MRIREDEMKTLYDEWGRRLFTCALAVTRCPDLAEDAVHDAFCRMMASHGEPPADLKAYAFRSVRNAAIDQMRKRSRTGPLPEGYEDFIFDPGKDPRARASHGEFQRRAANALLALGEDERETIVQHLYGDLTFREIAELRDSPLSTVASWYRRGIEKMRESLGEE